MIEQVRDVQCTERPVRFQAAGNDLLGIFTEPHERPRGVGAILTTGGAYIASPNRNRLSVRLARRLAEDGYHVLRFDYHGVGESAGTISGYPLDRPAVDDLTAAVRWCEAAGLHRLVLIGSCFGARTILATADRVSGLAGAALASTPLRDFEMGDRLPTRYAREMSLGQLVRKAFRPQVWRNILAPSSREAHLKSRHIYVRTAAFKVKRMIDRLRGANGEGDGANSDGFSDLFLTQFRRLEGRHIPVLMMYGTDEDFYRDFRRAQEGVLRDALPAGQTQVEIQTVDGVIHGFTTLKVQDAVVESTVAWARRLPRSHD